MGSFEKNSFFWKSIHLVIRTFFSTTKRFSTVIAFYGRCRPLKSMKIWKSFKMEGFFILDKRFWTKFLGIIIFLGFLFLLSSIFQERGDEEPTDSHLSSTYIQSPNFLSKVLNPFLFFVKNLEILMGDF